MRMNRALWAAVGCCLFSGSSFGSVGFQSFEIVSGPPSTQAFSSVGSADAPGPEAGSGATIAWPVQVNSQLLATLPTTLPVNFPDRPTLTFNRTRSERRGGNSFVWMGKGGDCSALFSVRDDGTQGTISCIAGQYGLDHSPGSSVTRLSRYDNSAYRSENEPPQMPTVGPPAIAESTDAIATADSWVDVLVLFPANTSIVNIWAFAQHCVDQTQLAIQDSTSPGHTPVQLRLVGASRTSVVSSDDVPGDLEYLLTVPEALSLRNYWAADALVFISNGSGLPGTALGQAQVPGFNGEPSPGPAFANHAAAAVLGGYATQPGQYVFAHELAHTFGANHNRDHTPANPTPVRPYAFGRWAYHNNEKGDGARTIMSYVEECTGNPCPRLLHYSNPDIFVDWFRTGTDIANNALLLEDIAPIEAQYRASVGRIFADGFQ